MFKEQNMMPVHGNIKKVEPGAESFVTKNGTIISMEEMEQLKTACSEMIKSSRTMDNVKARIQYKESLIDNDFIGDDFKNATLILTKKGIGEDEAAQVYKELLNQQIAISTNNREDSVLHLKSEYTKRVNPNLAIEEIDYFTSLKQKYRELESLKNTYTKKYNQFIAEMIPKISANNPLGVACATYGFDESTVRNLFRSPEIIEKWTTAPSEEDMLKDAQFYQNLPIPESIESFMNLSIEQMDKYTQVINDIGSIGGKRGEELARTLGEKLEPLQRGLGNTYVSRESDKFGGSLKGKTMHSYLYDLIKEEGGFTTIRSRAEELATNVNNTISSAQKKIGEIIDLYIKEPSAQAA